MQTVKLMTLALVLVPAVAHAEPREDGAPTERIKISDLDLRTPSGRVILARRINTAAEKLCPPANPTTQFLSPVAIKCRTVVVREAQVQIAAMAKRREFLAGR